MRSLACVSFALFLAAGCAIDSGSSDGRLSGDDVEDDGDEGGGDGDCEKIEGGEIGVVGLELRVGSILVTFDAWFAKDEGGEYAGFAYSTVGGDVRYIVKAGTERYEGDESPWMNPNGSGGSDVKGISNVVVCPPEEGTPDAGTPPPPPPDGDDDDGCDLPDGCGDAGPVIP